MPVNPDLRRLLTTIHRRLEKAYGPRPLKCWGDCVSVLIDTILSQNTTAANSNAGYKQLRRSFPSWTKVMNAPVEDVERCIHVSGLSNQKAPRIQAILRRIKADRGNLNLQFLGDLSDEETYDYLMRFNGVGPKTAHCTLLFSLGKAMFPVDTHIHRIARRLHLVPSRSSAEATQRALQTLIPPDRRYSMHVLLIEHGRKTCRAVSPACHECVLLDRCHWGQERLRAKQANPSRGR